MIKRGNYNSIFFLTTLGIYLGLVLVGLSTSALGQQVVITNNLGVQKEKASEYEGLEKYFLVQLDNALNTFVGDLQKLKRQGKYKLGGREEIIVGCGHTFCSDNIVDATSSFVDSWIAREFENLRKNLDLGADRDHDQVPSFVEELTDSNGNRSCKDFGLEFSIDRSIFQVKISFSQGSSPNAISTVANLNALFANKAATSNKASTLKFYQNTTAKAENNQVFVITRLPRGSLNALVRNK